MTRRRSRSSSSEESVPVENASKSPAPAAVLVPAQPAVESPFEDPAAGVPKQAHKEAPAHKEEKKKDKEDKKKGREKKSRSRRRRERSGSKEKHRGRSQEKKKPSRSKTHKEKKEKKPQGDMAPPEPSKPPSAWKESHGTGGQGWKSGYGAKSQRQQCPDCGAKVARHAAALDQHRFLNENCLTWQFWSKMSAGAQKDESSWHKAKLAARKLKLAREEQARAEGVDAQDAEESRAESPARTVASSMKLGEEAASGSARRAKTHRVSSESPEAKKSKKKQPSESPEPKKPKKKTKKERNSSSESAGASRRHKVVINIR